MNAYHDPGPPFDVTEWDVPAGQTLTVDLRNSAFPLGWSCIPAAGGTVEHRGANANEPEAADWLEPDTNGSISEATRVDEQSPVAWLRWQASGAAAKVAITANGVVLGTVE